MVTTEMYEELSKGDWIYKLCKYLSTTPYRLRNEYCDEEIMELINNYYSKEKLVFG